jgi:hypothetical protein
MRYELTYTIDGKEHVSEGIMSHNETWSDIVNEAIDSAKRVYPFSDVAFISFKEYDEPQDSPRTQLTQIDIPLDPDKREWEYDGYGKRRNKKTGQ